MFLVTAAAVAAVLAAQVPAPAAHASQRDDFWSLQPLVAVSWDEAQIGHVSDGVDRSAHTLRHEIGILNLAGNKAFDFCVKAEPRTVTPQRRHHPADGLQLRRLQPLAVRTD